MLVPKTKLNLIKIQPSDFPKKWGSHEMRCKIESISKARPGGNIEGWRGSGFWSHKVLCSNLQFGPLLTRCTTLPGLRLHSFQTVVKIQTWQGYWEN